VGKKSNMNSNRKNAYGIQNSDKDVPHRWDRIFGILTIASMILFGLILYRDFKGVHTAQTVQTAEKPTKKEVHTTTADEEKSTLMPIKSGSVICVDAGHGGNDKGTTFGGNIESIICLSVATALQEQLEQMGATVIMTRTSDKGVSQEQRVKIGNDNNADIFVSIHLNFSENDSANGAEAWIHSSKPADSLKASKNILEEIALETGIHNRNVKYGTLVDSTENYYINSHSKSASLMLELGFITNRSDMSVITEKTDSIARAIALGIAKYLNGGNQ